MQVMTRVNLALGLTLKVESLFRWPTVTDFASGITPDGLAQGHSSAFAPE
jgi:hypothetical protein